MPPRLFAVLAGTTALALSSAAGAADLPARRAPVMAAMPLAPTWTGFYVGLNAGGAWSESKASTSVIRNEGPTSYFGPANLPIVNATGQQELSPFGFIGGAQLGYNWQAGSLILGAETDFQVFNQEDTTSATSSYPGSTITFTITSKVSTDWLWTLRGRVGVLATPGLLVYATGGLALTELKGNFSFVEDFVIRPRENGTFSEMKTGWALGAGVEYAFAPGWTAKAEYLYADFGRGSAISNNLRTDGSIYPGTVFSHKADLTTQIARVGVNYRF